MRKWYLYWMAEGHHFTKDNPSSKKYFYIDIEQEFDITDKTSQEMIDEVMLPDVESWAESRSGGSSRGYEYGFRQEDPPTEWLKEELDRTLNQIKNLEEWKTELSWHYCCSFDKK